MICTRCNSNISKEIYRSKDTFDDLDHSHYRCENCGYEFNYWNETAERLKKVLEDRYKFYA